MRVTASRHPGPPVSRPERLPGQCHRRARRRRQRHQPDLARARRPALPPAPRPSPDVLALALQAVATMLYALPVFAAATYPMANNALVFGIIRGLHGFAVGMATTVNMALFMDSLAPGGNRHRHLAAYASALSLGYTIGGPRWRTARRVAGLWASLPLLSRLSAPRRPLRHYARPGAANGPCVRPPPRRAASAYACSAQPCATHRSRTSPSCRSFYRCSIRWGRPISRSTR